MSNESHSPYGSEFQQMVIRLMMLDDLFCAKASTHLHDTFFTGSLGWFFRKCKDYYVTYDSRPTDQYLRDEVRKFITGDEEQKYESERYQIAQIKSIIPSEQDRIRKELTGFIRANLFKSSIKEAGSLYTAGSKENAYDFTRRKVDEILKIDFEKERLAKFGDWREIVESLSTNYKNACLTGIAPIDKSLGGLLPQTWTTFIGSSSAGKSMICPTIAFVNAIHGKRSFITVHEDEEKPTMARYLSRFSGLPYNRLLMPISELSPEEVAKLDEADKMLKKHVVLKFMHGEELFVEKVQEAVRQMKRDWDFELFMCDYGQCLQSKMYKDASDKYNRLGYVYEQLKQTCLELNIAGCGGAQVNRNAHEMNKKGTQYLRMTDVGDSFEICRKSSNVITMNRSDDDSAKNRIVYLLDKARSGPAPVAVECISNYSSCITHMLDGEQREGSQGETLIGFQREIDVTGAARRGENDDES